MFGWSSSNDVDSLIARKKYDKAIVLLRKEIRENPNSDFLIQKLSDLLAIVGKKSQAIAILNHLIQNYVKAGFTTKAIAILKKIQRMDPNIEGLDEKVTELIRQRDRDQVGPSISTRGSEESIEIAEVEELALASIDDVVKDDHKLAMVHSHDELGILEPMDQSTIPVSVHDSPLFRHFSTGELLAIIRGLNLIPLQPGQIVFTEGEQGNSLFVVATGTLRVYVRNKEGQNEEVRLLHTGAFFGEISLLSGQPRTATIVCASSCELLELDIAALHKIAAKHPQIPDIIRDYYNKRLNSPEEREARGDLPK
jgi:tetratricopeptide (TPR) repeat protein